MTIIMGFTAVIHMGY